MNCASSVPAHRRLAKILPHATCSGWGEREALSDSFVNFAMYALADEPCWQIHVELDFSFRHLGMLANQPLAAKHNSTRRPRVQRWSYARVDCPG
ncbi:hypothetical protein RSal33209_3498 [Renibacterium salmoninarum ATCC 33209]|uniref:Uncharacterized protein n=1 Tax=Renibacterium salmoninarum (strain ATCC 33209 / DSM 20767 / JCM 11484 / NBRC 15589 / NCIMB 2235) TaxID=288705 RepID=A9WVI6_RENSM|nr:hypothetical protein RSal33209_3498 [Renibacterium salmoninarum ATCC 33209]